jgi:hypothetical protein
MNNKKAQVAIFMIIGLLILIVGLAIFYFHHQSVIEIVPQVYIKGEKIPVEFEPIKKYVDDCVYKVSREGLRLAGEHGGYISMVDPEINKASFKIVLEATESDAVMFSPGANLAIPYWWYLSSPNNCIGECRYASKRPDLRGTENSIEKQLERYVEKNLKRCLNDFEAFKSQGFDVEEAGDIDVNVVIAQSDVSVLVDYPIEVAKGSKSKITKYYALLPVNLQKIYELATKITNLEMQYRFLEKAVINLIASFAFIEEEKLPPVTDTGFTYGTTLRWSQSDVKNKVIEILNSYIGLFQMDATLNYNRNFFADMLEQRLYDAFIIPNCKDNVCKSADDIEDKYNDLSVSFSYLDFWPIYFDLNCNGEICEPESVNNPLLDSISLQIGIQRYNFMYDISYPVLIEIKEPNAFNGQGYDFRFFLEANLRNNEALPFNFTPLQAAGTVAQRTYLCDYGQRQSGDIAIEVIDSIEKKPTGDVKITYSVSGEGCYMGSTNESGILTTKFPTGTIGGLLSFAKEGYLSKSMLFDAGAEKKSISVQLDPLFEKNVVIRKKNLVKTGGKWKFVDKAVDLYDEEQAILTLVRKSPLEEQEYSAATEFTGSQAEPSKIEIAPGDYEATINVLLYKDLVIPEKKVHKDGGLFGEDIDYTLPGQRFSNESPYLSGGLKLDISISPADLQKYNTIVFYAVGQDLPSVPEQERDIYDLEQIGKYEKYAEVYATLLEPTFENR